MTRMVHRLLPDEGEVAGLLALILLLDARRDARTDSSGELVPLAEQDRGLWNGALIAEVLALLEDAIERRAVGEYELQAAIAAVHARARVAEETDWHQILALYDLLGQMTGNPIITLNRAVAAVMAEGPQVGLTMGDAVGDRLNGHYRVDAVRAPARASPATLTGQSSTTSRRRSERRACPSSAI
jgi:predicted RNA polymerase sigma factor